MVIPYKVSESIAPILQESTARHVLFCTPDTFAGAAHLAGRTSIEAATSRTP